ncbi:uncharacterized protein LOC110678433 [Aedes aegypti]|uniref:Uncharacterized protein n=1 Tax=Aedes aegypti TaxID=7159 RepID=A0A6I8U938_AEDAE|nr:uncharacterized protein LOC110678433 [Aedes aegypti]
MPRLFDTAICDASHIECYRDSFIQLYELAIRASLTGKSFKTCHCLPSCTSVEYRVGLSQVPINNFPYNLNFTRDDVDYALIFVSLKDRHYFPLWRRELVGTNQAIAQLGGLFALLMGSSMLSFAEVAYYCCIRPFRRELPRKKKKKQPIIRPRSRGHRIHLRIDPWSKHQHHQGLIIR